MEIAVFVTEKENGEHEYSTARDASALADPMANVVTIEPVTVGADTWTRDDERIALYHVMREVERGHDVKIRR